MDRHDHPSCKSRLLPLTLVALGLVAALSGCAGLSEGKTPEEIVTTRAQARWNAILADDWPTAYSYTTPAYRESKSLEVYRGMRGSHVARKGVRIHKVVCESAEACVATIAMRFTPPHLRDQTATLETAFDERWLLGEDGRWYIVHRD
jgi:hypothetical protein